MNFETHWRPYSYTYIYVHIYDYNLYIIYICLYLQYITYTHVLYTYIYIESYTYIVILYIARHPWMHVWKMVVFVAVAIHRGSCLRAHVQCDAGWGRVGRWWYKKPRWCFQIFSIFTPILGDMIQFDDHMFQMGWNHQPEAHLEEITPFQWGRHLHHTLGIFQPFFSGCFTGPKKDDRSIWVNFEDLTLGGLGVRKTGGWWPTMFDSQIYEPQCFWWFQKGSPN